MRYLSQDAAEMRQGWAGRKRGKDGEERNEGSEGSVESQRLSL